MPLEELVLFACKGVTDKGLVHLLNMPLQHLGISTSNNIKTIAVEINGYWDHDVIQEMLSTVKENVEQNKCSPVIEMMKKMKISP